MKHLLILAFTLFAFNAHAAQIKTIKSAHSFDETVLKIKNKIVSKNLTLFTSIEHHKGAVGAGIMLHPTTLIIFGNPKIGSLFMQENQLMGLELPLKILVYENNVNEVYVSYKDPKAFKRAYKLKDKHRVFKKVKKAMASIVKVVKS